jgi:hypothetical protein
VPIRGINPQTLKEITSSTKTPTLQGLKILPHPALKDEVCQALISVDIEIERSFQ